MRQELEEAKNRGFWETLGSGLKKVVTAPFELVGHAVVGGYEVLRKTTLKGLPPLPF